VGVTVWGLSLSVIAVASAALWLFVEGAIGAFFGCFALHFYARYYPALQETMHAPAATLEPFL
jgi:hypothetical protein